MGRVIAICITVAVLAGILAWVVVYFRRRQSKETALERGWALKGDLNRSQEQALIRQNNAAKALLEQMLTPLDGTTAAEWTFLSDRDRERAGQWLANNKNINKKGITQ